MSLRLASPGLTSPHPTSRPHLTSSFRHSASPPHLTSPPHRNSSHIALHYFASPHLTSFHLTPPHFASFHLTSSYITLPRLTSHPLHFTPLHLAQPHFTSPHSIPPHLTSPPLHAHLPTCSPPHITSLPRLLTYSRLASHSRLASLRFACTSPDPTSPRPPARRLSPRPIPPTRPPPTRYLIGRDRARIGRPRAGRFVGLTKPIRLCFEAPKDTKFRVTEAAVVLGATAVRQPAAFWRGARVVEIGSGAAYVGVLLAALGARVEVTDLPSAESVAAASIARNARAFHNAGSAAFSVLDWSRPSLEDPEHHLCLRFRTSG